MLYIIIALIAIATTWYKNSLMRRKAEGFFIDDFWAILVTVATISNVATVFFLAEVFAHTETWRLFVCVGILFVMDVLIYQSHKNAARRKGLLDAQYDITNDIKLS